jgi:hypothetical protein
MIARWQGQKAGCKRWKRIADKDRADGHDSGEWQRRQRKVMKRARRDVEMFYVKIVKCLLDVGMCYKNAIYAVFDLQICFATNGCFWLLA